MRILILLLIVWLARAADYRAPAGTRPAARRPGSESVLPGGRLLTPYGRQFTAGAGPFGVAVSRDGKFVVTANGGPSSFSLTLLDRGADPVRLQQLAAPKKPEKGEALEDDWESVFLGLAFDKSRKLYASEGNSGRVRRIALPTGRREEIYQLNQGKYRDSYSGDIALDEERGLLYVLDQAHFRVAVFSVKNRKVLASVPTGRLPFKAALSPDRKRLYVTNIGMFEYKVIPGAEAQRAKETGLQFPAFGFPSPESERGVRAGTELGVADVPPLGDPNVPESNSVCVYDVSKPEEPQPLGFVRTGEPFGPASQGGSSPSGLAVGADAVYVANANQDTITVIDPATLKVRRTITLRIPGLENLRGVLPIGLALDERAGRLYVAEAGINAVGVVDVRAGTVLGHIPAGWFPAAVAVEDGTLFVANTKGHGTGPNATRTKALEDSFIADIRQGTLSVMSVPPDRELDSLTARVMANNGFVAQAAPAPPLPAEIKHVVLIIKENRTYDEMFGDMDMAANGPLAGAPELARFGTRGWIETGRGQLTGRLPSSKYLNLSPNHHEMAYRWAFSDNFYVDSEVSVDGHHWAVGSYPNAWTESSLRAGYGKAKDFRLNPDAPGRLLFAQSNSSVHPEEQLEAGALWHHLERHGVTFRNFGEGFELAGVDEGTGLKPTGARFLTNVPMPEPLYRNTSRIYPGYNMNIPDQYRAEQFIKEVEALYAQPGKDLPRFIYIHLPNDHMTRPRPEDGYPFMASYVADNDVALGRIMEYLTHSRWWKNMAVLVTEDDAAGGVDHVDAHRTIMLVASPYVRRNYASHVNVSFPGMLKTIFRLLGIPPLNLFDATASDLSDVFQSNQPDFRPYTLIPFNREVFIPERARDPKDPQPGPAMDDPRVLREQHRRN